MKKLVLLLAVAALLLSMLCACSKTEPQADEKVLLKVSSWSREDSPEEQKQNWEALKKRYQDKYPNVEIDDSNTYVHNVQTFNAKAAAGQLPAWLDMPLTEIQMLRNNGYTADITQGLKDNGLLDKINPEILDLMTDENGKICGLPSSAYTQGLVINKQLFADAGLVDAEGNPLYPQTWEELAEYSQTIREKTGVAGFVMPTIENCGGWIFMNIAWSYGVNFEEQQKDGAWKAVFDTQEFRDAVSFVRDLKWKYNAFPDDTLLGYEGYLKSFATGLAAMTVADPGIINTLTSEYGMDKDDIVYAKLPAGPAGRYVLMGGSAKMFFADDTPEQIDAAIKWLMMEGVTPDITDDVEKTIRENCQQNIDNGGVVLPVEIFSIWQSPERSERLKEIYADYANVELSNFADYMDSTGVTLRPEETACCQQLYAVLDGVIQEVIANENADIDALTVTAVNDFQQNHLDKMDYTASSGGGAWGWEYHVDTQTETQYGSQPYKWYEKYFAEGEQNVQKIRRVTEDHSVKVSEVFSTMPSDEPMIPLIEGLAFDTANKVVVNILNDGGYMKGLPTDYEVEIAAIVDKHGVHPIHNNGLPKPIMTHLLRDRIASVEMELAAFENHSWELLVDLILMDPWTRTRQQAERLIRDIMALPCNKEMNMYYK